MVSKRSERTRPFPSLLLLMISGNILLWLLWLKPW